jgi:hypothetical protein
MSYFYNSVDAECLCCVDSSLPKFQCFFFACSFLYNLSEKSSSSDRSKYSLAGPKLASSSIFSSSDRCELSPSPKSVFL